MTEKNKKKSLKLKSKKKTKGGVFGTKKVGVDKNNIPEDIEKYIHNMYFYDENSFFKYLRKNKIEVYKIDSSSSSEEFYIRYDDKTLTNMLKNLKNNSEKIKIKTQENQQDNTKIDFYLESYSKEKHIPIDKSLPGFQKMFEELNMNDYKDSDKQFFITSKYPDIEDVFTINSYNRYVDILKFTIPNSLLQRCTTWTPCRVSMPQKFAPTENENNFIIQLFHYLFGIEYLFGKKKLFHTPLLNKEDYQINYNFAKELRFLEFDLSNFNEDRLVDPYFKFRPIFMKFVEVKSKMKRTFPHIYIKLGDIETISPET